jgi:hypothetical protein
VIRSDLHSFSPAIDACLDGLATDSDGNARPISSDYGMGACEGFDYVILMPTLIRHDQGL